jgi:hypothetical protein
MSQDGFTYRFEQLTFIETSGRIKWSPHFKQIFWDLDGSLTGVANSYLLKWYPFNAWSSSCYRVEPTMYDDSMVCVNTTVRRLEIDFVKPNQVDFTDLLITGGEHSDEIYFLPKNIYGWVIPLVMNHTYRLNWRDAEISPYALIESWT